jgi:predicted acyltransferase
MSKAQDIMAKPARDFSLDAFRGSDVLLMIIVNVQGNGDAAFPYLSHAEWNGLTLADMVFPIFLLIAGLSAPLALDRPKSAMHGQIRWSTIARRAAYLALIGVVLSWLIRPTLDPDLIRWSGVLQRIAIVYFVCASVILLHRGRNIMSATRWAIPAGLAIILLALHSWILLRVGVPGSVGIGSGPSMEPGMGFSGWLDQNFIPGRVLRKTWEPEGILSTLPSIASGLIGVAAMRWLLLRQKIANKPLADDAILGILGLLLVLIGAGLSPWLPINKNLWTASFALVTSGAGLCIYAGLRAGWPMMGTNRIARWAVSLGQAALTLYIVHTLLIAIIVRKLPSGEKIWDVLWRALAGTGLHAPTASLLFAVVAAVISCAILPLLVRRGWVLKL